MACYNHPNAPTVAICQGCHVEMCGMCTQFLDAGEFCEKCAQQEQTKTFISSQTRQLQQAGIRSKTTIEVQQDSPQPEPRSRRDQDRIYIWAGVIGASGMIFFSMLLYSFPMLFEFDAEAAAARQAAQALEDCRLVFEEIGYILEAGNTPDESMRCASSNVPNVISRSGDLVTVSHPNPRVHGLAGIYVTNESHQVVFVESEEG